MGQYVVVDNASQSRAFQFGDWLVEPHVNRVSRGDEEKHLERKAMEVLAYLLERAGETVSSGELQKHVWADRVVEESAVHQRISKIRRILGDDAHNPRYIENIPRRGYRTVATVARTPITQETNPEMLATLHARTPPFPAYTGDAPYVFVCYSHRDREQVYPELVRLRDAGVNVWYDEGIKPGKAWPEELAIAINGCVRFLYFVSPQSVESRNCLNELEFALDANKTLVAVHLEHTTLSEGLQLSIGRTQAIFKYDLLSADYNRKLLNTLAGTAAPQALRAISRAQRSTPRALKARNVGFLLAVGLGVIAIGFYVVQQLERRSEFASAMPEEKHLVVIPFQVFDDDSRTELVAAGLVEALTSKLIQLRQFHRSLWVVSASEVRNRTLLVPSEARRAFGVTLAITGSVRRAESGYLVTVKLVDTRSLRLLWSQAIDESAGSVHTLQDRIVFTLAQVFGIDLPPGARDVLLAGGTSLLSANALYLEGRGYLQRYENEENVDRAGELFIEALNQDPDFALALVGMGEAYLHKYELSREPRWVKDANNRITRAIEIQPRLALVHVALGKLQTASGQYQDAVGAFQRALELDSLNAGAYQGLARAYKSLGELEEAESTYQKAIELQADYWGTHNELGVFYYQTGRYREAAGEFRKVTELTPDNPRGYTNLGAAYSELGRDEDAADMLQRSVMIEPSVEGYSNLGTRFALLGRYADAARQYEQAIELNEGDFRLWRNLGAAYHHLDPPAQNQADAAYERCVGLANEELQVNPRDTEVMINLADCHSMLRNTERALAFLKRALEDCPDDVDLIFRAGDAYEQLGDRDEALGWIGEAVCRGKSLHDIELSPGLAELRADPRFADVTGWEGKACTGFRSCGTAR